MKRREPTAIFMDLLTALFDGPKVATRLAQSCNLNYGRLDNFTDPLLAKGLIRKDSQDGVVLFAITEAGYKLYQDWLGVWKRLPLG